MRTGVAASLAMLLLLASMTLQAQTIALTFDDGFDPRGDERAAGLNQSMLDTLRQHQVRAMFFPAGMMTDSPEGLALVRHWGEAGHLIGNHTYQHQGLSQVGVAAFIDDMTRSEQLFRSMPGWCPRLRFPYLDEGDTPAVRNTMLKALAERGYGLAPVTVTTDDWNEAKAYDQIPSGDLNAQQAYRASYLDKLWGLILGQQQQWQATLGRRPHHVLLLHANALNAAVLPALLDRLQGSGWQIVDPALAFQDPIYQRGYHADDALQGPLLALPVPACGGR